MAGRGLPHHVRGADRAGPRDPERLQRPARVVHRPVHGGSAGGSHAIRAAGGGSSARVPARDDREGRPAGRHRRRHPERAGPLRRLDAGRLVARAPGLRRRGRGTRGQARARARGTRRAGRGGRARTDRARAPRRGHPSRERHRHPGGRGAPSPRPSAGGGADGRRRHRFDRSPGAGRHAPDARHPGDARGGRGHGRCRRHDDRSPRADARTGPARRAARGRSARPACRWS